jgi:hypothetical protein
LLRNLLTALGFDSAPWASVFFSRVLVLAICLRCARVRRERFSRFDFRHWLPVRFVVLSSLFRFNLAARPDSLAVRPHCFGPWISSPHFCGCHCPDFLCRCGARADPARDFSSARGASLGPILSSWLRHETKFSCARKGEFSSCLFRAPASRSDFSLPTGRFCKGFISPFVDFSCRLQWIDSVAARCLLDFQRLA